MECFPIPGETVRATMIPAPIKFIGMFMITGINKVTIQVIMVMSTLFVPVRYLLLPIVTLSVLNSQSLISALFLQQFLFQQYPFHGMHAVIVPSGIAVRRDETYGRLDKMMGGYLIPVHFCPASIPHVVFNGCITVQLSCLDQGTLAVPYPMHALVLCILLVQYHPFLG